jgi:hypothetical protein
MTHKDLSLIEKKREKINCKLSISFAYNFWVSQTNLLRETTRKDNKPSPGVNFSIDVTFAVHFSHTGKLS